MEREETTCHQRGVGMRLTCVLVFPGARNAVWKTVFKMAEFILFFLVPVVVQVCLYVVIGRKLFVGSKDLHQRQQVSLVSLS